MEIKRLIILTCLSRVFVDVVYGLILGIIGSYVVLILRIQYDGVGAVEENYGYDGKMIETAFSEESTEFRRVILAWNSTLNYLTEDRFKKDVEKLGLRSRDEL